jgi:hypothetical protein
MRQNLDHKLNGLNKFTSAIKLGLLIKKSVKNLSNPYNS